MLFVHGSLSLLLFAFWVLTLIDVVTTDDAAFRNLNKIWWTALVLLGLELGAVLWLVAGRSWSPTLRPRPVPVPVPVTPRSESTEEFLLRCRQRAEEQRRRYREQAD
jgi:hypothetical protein